MSQDKYVIGLTGNIAMGKSLVRQMLQHLGAYTLDADGLTHQVMNSNAPAYRPIVEMFGKFVLKPDKEIDRARLGAIAFSHPDALRELEKITHPLISSAIDTIISKVKHHVVVVEAIKLLEGDLSKSVDEVWVVNASTETQLKRLVQKRGLSDIDARKRITIQNPQSEKLAKADVIINNDGAPDDTWAQVQAAWKKMVEKSQEAAEDSRAMEVVERVDVKPKAQPAPDAGTTAPPKPNDDGEELDAVDIKRPRPSDFESIAQLINQETDRNITRSDIMATFGEKTYMMAADGGKAVGVIAFLVENLVTQVDEMIINSKIPLETVGKALITAMEKASDELQSEVAFVYLPPEDNAKKQIFVEMGYKEMKPEEVRYPAWREAVTQYHEGNKVLLSKRLRENLVLKPI